MLIPTFLKEILRCFVLWATGTDIEKESSDVSHNIITSSEFNSPVIIGCDGVRLIICILLFFTLYYQIHFKKRKIMFKSIIASLLLSLNVETGHIPKWSSLTYQAPEEYNYKCYKRSFYAKTKIDIVHKYFYISPSYTLFLAKDKESYQFSPYKGVFPFDIGVTFENFTIGYAHKCEHTITYIMTNRMDKRAFADESYDKIFISFKISNKACN